MLSKALPLSTVIFANLIVHGPAVMSQDLGGLNLGNLDLAGLNAGAFSPASLPKCAITCALSTYSSTGCILSDVACFCKNEDFIRNNKACFIATCPADALAQAAGVASKVCGAAGVPISSDILSVPTPKAPVPTATALTTASISRPTPEVLVPSVSIAPLVPAASPVAIVSAPAIPIPVVSTTPPAIAALVNTTIAVKPTVKDNIIPQKNQSISAPAQANSTVESADSDDSASSASSTNKAINILVIGSTFLTLFFL